jgi:hypothetical protein
VAGNCPGVGGNSRSHVVVMSLKVIAIAPEIPNLPRLAAWEELGQIGDIDGITLNIVPAPTRQRIAEWLKRGCYDVFLWIGHGSPGRLALAGGAVEPNWLAAQLMTCKTTTAVIATCSSLDRPDAPYLTQGFSDILPAAGIDTVTMQTDVPDLAALKYDVALIQALSTGIPLRQAHNVGLAAAAEYGGVQMAQLFPADASARIKKMNGTSPHNDAATLRSLSDKMDKVGDQVHAMDVRQGRVEIKVEQLVKDQEQQKKEIADIRQSIQQLRADFHAPAIPKQWLLSVSGALVIMLVFLVVIMLRVLS